MRELTMGEYLQLHLASDHASGAILQLQQAEQSADHLNGLHIRILPLLHLPIFVWWRIMYAFPNKGTGRMTDASLAADIIVSTLFFILTMYGSIMGGSGEVKITPNVDLNQAVGGAPANQ